MKKNIWKMVRLMIAAVAAAAACTAAASAAETTWVDAGNYSAPTLNPTTNEITIDTPQELAWVSYSVMNGNTFEGYTILLEDDIDLAGHLWQPIGGWDGSTEDTTKYFAGTFDGQGYDVLNMTVERPDYDYNGFFGCIEDATVKNLELLDCAVEGSQYRYTAALIGSTGNSGSETSSVWNCGASGVVTNGSGLCGKARYDESVYFYNCYSRVELSEYGYAFGEDGTYVNCWHDADLRSDSRAGDDAEILECYGITEDSLEDTDYVTLLNEYLFEDKLEWVEGEDGYPAFGTKFDFAWKNNTIEVEPQGDTYYISSAGELAYIAELVNSGNRLTDYTVKLMRDIDLSGKCWTPIGGLDTVFEGNFNGNNKTITGMTIMEHPFYENVGLIGEMEGNVADLTLNKPAIEGAFDYPRGIGCLIGELSGSVTNCHVFNCDILVDANVGGLVGCFYGGDIRNCSVSGDIESTGGGIGGIVCEAGGSVEGEKIIRCTYFGNMKSEIGTGGIACTTGWGATVEIAECYTLGTMSAKGYAGGIFCGGCDMGDAVYIRDCYSACSMQSLNYSSGGIMGSIEGTDKKSSVQNCYAFGDIGGSRDTGALFGGVYDANTIAIENCYWYDGVKMTQLGMEVPSVGMAGATDLTKSLTLAQMKKQRSFTGFDFYNVWAISSDKNGGFPYLRWQTAVPEVIAPTGIGLNTSSLTMETGSERWLAVSFEPANAFGTIIWSSEDENIARVTEGGQVIAVSVGETVITAKCGKLTASCAVTVSERPEDSYVLGELELLSASEQPLDAIPRDSFWVNVSVTKQEESDDAVVVLATYGSDGKFLNLYAMKTNAAVGTEQVFSVLLDNRAGKIAEIRAFVWSSLASPVPLAASVGV